ESGDVGSAGEVLTTTWGDYHRVPVRINRRVHRTVAQAGSPQSRCDKPDLSESPWAGVAPNAAGPHNRATCLIFRAKFTVLTRHHARLAVRAHLCPPSIVSPPLRFQKRWASTSCCCRSEAAVWRPFFLLALQAWAVLHETSRSSSCIRICEPTKRANFTCWRRRSFPRAFATPMWCPCRRWT